MKKNESTPHPPGLFSTYYIYTRVDIKIIKDCSEFPSLVLTLLMKNELFKLICLQFRRTCNGLAVFWPTINLAGI